MKDRENEETIDIIVLQEPVWSCFYTWYMMKA